MGLRDRRRRQHRLGRRRHRQGHHPPTGSITINDGAAYTRSPKVTLALLADDTGGGVDRMQFSEDGTAYGDWELCTAARDWTLASGDDGTRSVYVRYSDPAGNVSDPASATITLDTTAPGATLTFPADDGAYSAAPWAAGCTPPGLCGTAFSKTTEEYLPAATTDGWAHWHHALDLPEVGQYTLHVRATDHAGNAQTPLTTATFTVDTPTITLLPASLPDGREGVPYSADLTASGGTSPYTFTIPVGGLPGGLSLSTSGEMRGTPLSAATFFFTVMATDAYGYTGSRAYSVTVTEALEAPVVTAHPEDRTVDEGGTAAFTAAASGNPAPTVQWQVSTDGGSTWDDVPGATETTLTLTNVSPDMDGYRYRAVFTNSEGSVPSNDATLTVRPIYTVTFDAQGGSPTPAPQTVVSGDRASEPGEPTKDGYTFDGWFTDNTAYTDRWDFCSAVTADVTLYAKWTAVAVYTVTFDANGGAGTMAPQTAGAPAALTINGFSRAGHSFSGWNTAKEGTGTPYADGAVYAFDANVTLYAQWTALAYTVRFDSQGGTAVDSQVVPYGSPVVEPTAPSRDGYTLDGWFVDAEGSDAWDFATDTVTADTTLYARWAAVTVVPSVTGVSPASLAVDAYGETIGLTGTGFVADSTIRWHEPEDNHSEDLTPTSVSATELLFSAPAGRLDVPKTVELTVVNPGPGGGRSNIQPLLVTSPGASVTHADTVASADGTAEASVQGVRATGTGDGTLYVAQLDGRPTGDEPAFTAAGSYVDVYASADSAFCSIVVQVCSEGLKRNTRLYWWTGAAWETVSPAAEYSAGPPACLAFTATAGSRPSVDQLTGTVFVAGTDDDAAPTVARVTSAHADGAYREGVTIDIAVEFTEVVIVSTAGGSPTLALETGAADREADYLEGSASSALTFRYVVQAGDTSGDLDYVSESALRLNGGAIEDAAGNGATLTLPAPGSPGSLGGSKAIVVDTTAPTVVATVIQGSGAPGHLRPGDIYLLYADVADAASGVDGVVADLSAITAEATGVPLTSAGGPWSVGGITYSHRSDQQTADTSLEGVVDYAVNATDAAGNTTDLSSNGSVAVDSPGREWRYVFPYIAHFLRLP